MNLRINTTIFSQIQCNYKSDVSKFEYSTSSTVRSALLDSQLGLSSNKFTETSDERGSGGDEGYNEKRLKSIHFQTTNRFTTGLHACSFRKQ